MFAQIIHKSRQTKQQNIITGRTDPFSNLSKSGPKWVSLATLKKR